MLEEPNIQVFERSAKQEQAEEPDTGTQVQAPATEPPLEATKAKVALEAKNSSAKTQSLKVTITESKPAPSGKSDAQVQSYNAKTESKSKKIGKFNVDIR